MLIRLLPAPNQPTVIFKLTFENPPHHLIYPPSWSNQLAALSCDDLEVPELVHALDKTVGAQSMLEEVSFNLIQSKIKCVFVDGEVEEWVFGTCLGRSRGPADSFHIPKEHDGDAHLVMGKLDIIRRLESVLADINESAAEMDRERKREEEREKERLKLQEEDERLQRQEEELSVADAIVPAHASGKKKHKKNRSLLLNLVSSLFPLSLNSPAHPKSPRSTGSPKSSSLPSSRASSRSPPSSRSPSRTPSVCSIRSEIPKSGIGCSSAPASLSRANTISAVLSEYNRGDRKAFAGWNRRHRRRGRTLSTSSADLPVDVAQETRSDGVLTANVSARHTPEGSEHSALVGHSTHTPETSADEQALKVENQPPIVIVAPPPLPPLTPRALRRRARSTLVDTFRMFVIPELTRRMRCGQYFSTTLPGSSSSSMVNSTAATSPTSGSSSGLTLVTSTSASSTGSVYTNPASGLSAPVPTIPLYHPNNVGGDSILYYVWILGSMLKRVETRIGEVIREAREEMERLEQGGISLGLSLGSFSSSSSLNSLYNSAVGTTMVPLSDTENSSVGAIADAPIYHEGIVGVASASVSPFETGNSSSEGSSKESFASTSEVTGSAEYDSDTDTDGSSLHTPTALGFHDPFCASDSSFAHMSSFGEDLEGYKHSGNDFKISPSGEPYPPSLNSPSVTPHPNVAHFTFDDPSQETPTHAPPPLPTQPLSPQLTSLLSQHTQLTALHTHLHHLLILAHARVSSASAEAGQREVMLEVRGRRRAWLNGSYRLNNRIQGTVVSVSPSSTTALTNSTALSRAGIAMATTSHTSPLGRYSWTSDEWDCDPFAYLDSPRLYFRRKSSGDRSTSASPTLSSGPTSPFLECYPNPFEFEGEGSDGVASYGTGVYGHRKKRSASETTLFPVEEDDESESESVSELEYSDFSSTSSLHHQHHHRVKLDFGVSLYRHAEIDVDVSSDEEEDGDRGSGETAGDDEDEDEDVLRDVDALVDVELDVPEDQDDVPFEEGAFHRSGSVSDLQSRREVKAKELEDRREGSVSPTSSKHMGPNLLLPGHDFTLAMDVLDIDVADNIDNVDPLEALPPRRKSIAMMAAANSMKMSQTV